MPLCHCGSGEEREAEYDARGIFLTYVCRKCRKEKLSGFRNDVLEDPNYECDEDIEPEPGVGSVDNKIMANGGVWYDH